MNGKPKESDWKKFSAMVPELRERYLQRKNPEMIAILQDEARTPTEQFWDAEDLVRKQAKILRECFDGHSRSKMLMFLLTMRRHGVLDDEDLRQFSEELQKQVQGFPA